MALSLERSALRQTWAAVRPALYLSGAVHLVMPSGAHLTLIKTLALPRTHDIPTASRQTIDGESICRRNRAACLLDLSHHKIFNRSST